MSIEQLLTEAPFDFVSNADKAFICAFTEKLSDIGYTCGDTIRDGICWGKYMLIFTKRNTTGKKVYARIYIKDNGISLRYFLSNVTKHGDYIINSPDYIQSTFIDEHGKCSHCRGDVCKFRKSYFIGGNEYEKCNGVTFEFFQPSVEKLNEYLNLFTEFYPTRKK